MSNKPAEISTAKWEALTLEINKILDFTCKEITEALFTNLTDRELWDNQRMYDLVEGMFKKIDLNRSTLHQLRNELGAS